MLTKDDIVFEEDFLAHSHTNSQDEVKNALVDLINAFVSELNIKRLEKVIVKKTDFFDTELGIANYKNYTIVLANNIAFCLADKNARFHQRSLAVLKHELYHFQDFQNLLLNRVFKRIPEINAEVLDDFHYWSEFLRLSLRSMYVKMKTFIPHLKRYLTKVIQTTKRKNTMLAACLVTISTITIPTCATNS